MTLSEILLTITMLICFALAECEFCKTFYKAPLYEMKKPIFRPCSPWRGGGERNRKWGECHG